MQAMESIISIFGSRFSFNFRPRESKIDHSGLGRMYDAPLDFALGIEVDGDRECLPFTKQHPHFPATFQSQTMNTVSFSGRSNDFLTEVRVTFISHFLPDEEFFTTLPVFIIDIEARKIPTKLLDGNIEGRLFLSLGRPGTALTASPSGGASLTYKADGIDVTDAILAFDKEKNPVRMSVKDGRLHVLDIPYSVDDEFEHVATLFWASYIGEPVLETRRGKVRFAYTKNFTSALGAAIFATKNEEQIREIASRFDKVFDDPSIGKIKQDFLAYAFQSFVQNAWLGYLDDGRKWYSSWEGSCQFHSTIDVEYNQAWFYFCFWPELLDLLLDEWAEYQNTNQLGLTFLSHDMGHRRSVTRQDYPHDMEVEENANYLLLLLMAWKHGGNASLITGKKDVIIKIVDHLIGVDTTGNGFPNEGTANTIDDASPAIQYAREQTYLGVKTGCALQAAAEMAGMLGSPSLQERCTKQLSLIKRTLDEKAWLGDHYAVCIDKDARGLNEDGRIYTPLKGSGTEIEGWDAYTLYTSNGLLYLFSSGVEPFVDKERIHQDMITAWKASLGEYGNFHSSTDHSNCWISQNLFRDFIGMYMGILIDQFDRYWNFQVWENTVGRGGCFVDTFGLNHLRYYPRGATAFGLFYAMPSVSIDKTSPGEPEVTLRPTLAPFTLPLVQFTDWNSGRSPRVHTWVENGELKAKVEQNGCLEGINLIIKTK